MGYIAAQRRCVKFRSYRSMNMMKIIKNTGLILITAGALLFFSYLWLSNYKLTETALRSAVTNTDDLKKLEPAFTPMFGKDYGSNIKFVNNVNSIITTLNDGYKSKGEWDKVIWTNYNLSITKNSATGYFVEHNTEMFLLIFLLVVAGAVMYIVSRYSNSSSANNNVKIFKRGFTSKGITAILLGVLLIGFYILMYWYPEYITNWVILVDPLSLFISGHPASQWFLYGFLYTIAVLVMGLRMIMKYRHNRYQLYRTGSVMFFQLAFAFLIPEILVSLNKPWYDFKNMWPLDYDFFYSWNLDQLLSSGTLGLFMLVWGIILFAVIAPIFTYFFGKRWYCSWVCGCGGLAETAGDPFRQLSSKTVRSWKIERWLIHGVLIFAVVMTTVTLINYFSDYSLLGNATNKLHQWYGFFIGSVFSGVVGTGFYPILGNRVWCRFGCPLAAYMGIIQRFKSRFRITTNGGQCISCGNCSTYCEMGIDVRAYAQNNKNIVRASCVGCGICAEVCPRGVLKLETKPVKNRINEPVKLLTVVKDIKKI